MLWLNVHEGSGILIGLKSGTEVAQMGEWRMEQLGEIWRFGEKEGVDPSFWGQLR